MRLLSLRFRSTRTARSACVERKSRIGWCRFAAKLDRPFCLIQTIRRGVVAQNHLPGSPVWPRTGAPAGDKLVPLVPAAPAPLPKWANVLLRALPFAWAVAEDLVSSTHDASSVSDVEWRKVVLRWNRETPGSTVEDYAQISLHILNLTGGDIDTTWTTSDYTTCETALNEWLTSMNTVFSSKFTLVDYRWYSMRFASPMSELHRFDFSGPPLRITVKGTPGGSTGAPLPYQNALSVTFDSGVPKHWGRVYLPGLTVSALDVDGRVSAAYTGLTSNAFAELFDDLYGAEFQPVVAVTQVNKVLAPALLTVKQVRVDDIVDVVRRRRPRTPRFRTVGVPTP